MNYYQRALELEAETIKNRRHLHQNPEVGLRLPETVNFVTDQLREYGLDPQPCGHGVTALLGREGPVILLRADMDALPIREESGESFSSQNGAMHGCGHDVHTAMLLTAAKMLKERESELKGRVKLMFQSGEEIFQGAADMIAHGVLRQPKPDAALAFHVAIGKAEPGMAYYNAQDVMMNSVDGFQLTIHGKQSHGACPHQGVDPINIGVHLHLALQALIARETDPTHAATLTIGQFTAGTAANILPDTAVLQGTLRTDDGALRSYLTQRLRQVAEQTAELFRGSVDYEVLSAVPELRCDRAVTEEMAGYMAAMDLPGFQVIPGAKATASEDFALIAAEIPSCYMYLTAGFSDERGSWPVHHPKARFNEKVLPIGSACLAECATQFLAHHKT